jgi:hypothetical protein
MPYTCWSYFQEPLHRREQSNKPRRFTEFVTSNWPRNIHLVPINYCDGRSLWPTVTFYSNHRRASQTLERRTEPSHPFGCPSQAAQPSPTPKRERARRLRSLAPQSQLFFQSYESILPTSLTYILYLDKSFLSLGTCCGYWYGDRTNEDTSNALASAPPSIDSRCFF